MKYILGVIELLLFVFSTVQIFREKTAYAQYHYGLNNYKIRDFPSPDISSFGNAKAQRMILTSVF